MWFLLFFSLSLYGSGRQPSTPVNSPFHISVGSQEEEQDSFCDSALSLFHPDHSRRFNSTVKPKLKGLVQAKMQQSGDEITSISHEDLQRMTQGAIQMALEEMEDKKNAKFSKKQVSIIGIVAAVIPSFIAIMVDSYSCKK